MLDLERSFIQLPEEQELNRLKKVRDQLDEATEEIKTCKPKNARIVQGYSKHNNHNNQIQISESATTIGACIALVLIYCPYYVPLFIIIFIVIIIINIINK